MYHIKSLCIVPFLQSSLTREEGYIFSHRNASTSEQSMEEIAVVSFTSIAFDHERLFAKSHLCVKRYSDLSVLVKHIRKSWSVE